MQLRRFWQVLADLSGHGQVLEQWQEDLGDEFERTRRFLQPTDELATVYPCPRPGGEGCPREVIHHSADHIVAACRDVPPSCDLLRLERSDLILYEIDLKSVLRQVGQALNLRLALKRESHALWYLGTVANAGAASIEVLVALSQEPGEFEALISGLLLDRGHSFLLLVPCLSQVSAPTLDRCRRKGVKIVGFSDLLGLGDSGTIELEGAVDLPALGLATAQALPNTFRFDGDSWTLALNGKSVSARDTKGLHYLQRLLRSPGVEFSCLDLYRDVISLDEPLPLGRGIERVDSAGLKKFKDRFESRQEQLREAEKLNDPGGIEFQSQKLKELQDEITAATGLGGEPRKAKDSINRIRDSVGHAIRRAIERLENPHKELHRHLKGTVKLGLEVRYSPAEPVTWITE